MLRSLLKSCLAIAMIGAMAAPTFAVDVKTAINGGVETWMQNVAVKDGTTTTEMLASADLGGSVTGTAGAWTVTAFADMSLENKNGTTSLEAGDMTITFENDAIDITTGWFDPWGVSVGGEYMAGEIADTYGIGENMPNGTQNHVKVGIKSVGVSVVYGMNHSDSADGTMDAHNRTTMGVIYSGTFGPVSVGAQYYSDASAIDEEDSDATTDGPYDGGAYSSMALGVKYAILDTMAVSFNYAAGTEKAGNADDATTATIMELFFDMAIDKDSGVSVGYSTMATDDGSDKVLEETKMNLTYNVLIGQATVYAGYYADTAKDDDIDPITNEKTDSATTRVGFGASVEF